ncbi:unnamed protein product [Periconia digitata]|uniref:Uncharacterized protein n=1 Tax=Periconia digitata TaxID=1303443 RepID=A0A9W4U383_9PLEO|nr:unnamed protein product [Periconia digitata]
MEPGDSTAQSYFNGSSSEFQRSISPKTTMSGFPGNLSLAQQEAVDVLQHLLAKLKEPGSKYYERYGGLVERHADLDEFCFSCIRPYVWRFLEGRWNLDALKLVGGDLRSDSRGVYFSAIHGLDKQTRIYIGQSQHLRIRIAQHWNFRYRRDNPSLHYHAMQQSIFNVFGIVAVLPPPNAGNHALPGMDCPDLLLNILEMWMALAFKSLPKQTLVEWLPEGAGKDTPFGPLNISNPLETGGSERGWVDLSDSKDLLIQDYIRPEKKKEGAIEKMDEEPEKKPDLPPPTEKNRAIHEQLVIQISSRAMLIMVTAAFVGFAVFSRAGGSVPKPNGRWR